MTSNKYLQLIQTIACKLGLGKQNSVLYPLCDNINLSVSFIDSPSDFVKIIRSLLLAKKNKGSLHLKDYAYGKYYDLGALVLVCDFRKPSKKYFFYLITKEEWQRGIFK